MSEPALKCEKNAIFKQNYTQKLFISFKISFFLFWLWGKSGISSFPPK